MNEHNTMVQTGVGRDSMRNRNYRNVPGWGADLDPANRPAYPKERTPPRLDVVPREPVSQPRTVRVFHSNERPGMTPVFGTTVPPKGLSGKLRERAFKYSENDLRHWLLLLFADRVNVGEGIVADMARGHIPNFFRESGGRAAMRYNRAGTIKRIAIKTAVAAAVVGAGIYLINRKRARRAREA